MRRTARRYHILTFFGFTLVACAALAYATGPGKGKGKGNKTPGSPEVGAFEAAFRDFSSDNIVSDGGIYIDSMGGVRAEFTTPGNPILDPDLDPATPKRHFVFSFPDPESSSPVQYWPGGPNITCDNLPDDLCDIRDVIDWEAFNHRLAIAQVKVLDPSGKGKRKKYLGRNCNGDLVTPLPITDMDTTAANNCRHGRLGFQLLRSHSDVFLRCGQRDDRDGDIFDQVGTDDVRMECTAMGDIDDDGTDECVTWDVAPFDSQQLICRLWEHVSGPGSEETRILGDFNMTTGLTITRTQ